MTPRATRAPAIKVVTLGRRRGGSAGIVWGRDGKESQVIEERLTHWKSLWPRDRRSKLPPFTTDLFNFVATNEPVLSNVKGREGIVHPETKDAESVS